MKNSSRSWFMTMTVAAAVLTFGTRAFAETPREELVHSYRLLSKANSDYAGHRVKAMDDVSAAAKDLGLDLTGDLSAGERQWKSDEQMKEARRLLKEASDKLEKRDRD